MKNIVLLVFMGLLTVSQAQTTKSKNLKIKYTLPASWNAEEFGGKSPWEDVGNDMCHCAGAHFFKSHKEGKMHVLIYPSTQAGLDSTKRYFVGTLHFEDVAKYDNIRNNDISFRRKKSNFTDSKTKAKSYEAYQYFAKVDDHFYLIYAWQENMQALNSTNERELFTMVNALEAN